jgi:hypothetical protein
MHVRTTTRKTKSGEAVRYLQLAHNQWDPATKTSRPKVLYSFGREDQLDREAISRLVASLSRLLDPVEALSATTPGGLAFLSSRPLGGTWVLDALWRRVGIGTAIGKLLAGRKLDEQVERVLFALVAHRALEPGSKLAATRWVARRTHIDELDEVSDDACYRAMDFLIEAAPKLEEEVFWATVTLLDAEVDLLLFDTTSTYFELKEPDAPVPRNERGMPQPADATSETSTTAQAEPQSQQHPPTGGEETSQDATATGEAGQVKQAGFRTHGNSKDARPDLPQIIIGMAVTRAGIPVRCWSWPGNTSDGPLIRQVKKDMTDWTLSRVVWVGDRGFTSAANRRYLRRGGNHYILGEKLRSGSAEASAALGRPGRYRTVADNLAVKEVRIACDERFVVCYNPEQAPRDAALRELMVAKLTEWIAESDKLSADKRAELRGKISTKPGLARYLRTTGSGLLRLDKAKIKTEAGLDGKYLLRSSDPSLSVEDIALSYKQLLAVEAGWRAMKTTLELRPVYHRLEDRIRAHVLLCWLALLLVRIAENVTGWTWYQLRPELEELHLGTFEGPAGTFRQRTELTPTKREVFAKLAIDPPTKILELTASAA